MSAITGDRKKDYLRTVHRCDAALLSNPGDSSALRRRGEAKRKLGEFLGAVSDFDAVIAIDPDCAIALAGRGAAKRALARHGEAISDFDAAIRLDPKSVPILVGRATVKRDMGMPAEAIVDSNAALKIEPSSAFALQLRGELRRKLGMRKDAIADFDEAVRVVPHYAVALAGRGAAKRALSKFSEALADYGAALAMEPRNAAVLAGRGATWMELGRLKEASADFDLALQVDPQDAYAMWGRRIASRREGRQPLQSLSLSGFERPSMNVQFVERRQPEFAVNGRETFWCLDGSCFIYWCKQESRWKGSCSSDLHKNQAGSCYGFAGAPVDADISSPSLIKGWHEWDGERWVLRPGAGVDSIGPLEAPLRAITLSGFGRVEVNTQFVERRQPEYAINERETYWSLDGHHLLYWCAKESRWKVSYSRDLQRNQEGGCFGFLGAPQGADVAALRRSWHEWDGVKWVLNRSAGISNVVDVRPMSGTTKPPSAEQGKVVGESIGHV